MNSIESTLKSFTWALVVVALTFTSCSDDEDPVIDKANLTGSTWIYDHADAGDQIASAIVDAFLAGTEYTFSTDNTYSSVRLGFESEGTWEYGESTITLNPGETLEEVWEVTELSANTLVYISTTIDSETNDESKITYIYKR
ncbi:lipocalin family protein [Reichenbachiella sp.]|uniref:lipocalin family protein n=1 Tax=Reichenbachiella sp. TaxID=2184521 RepID=UPI003298E47B